MKPDTFLESVRFRSLLTFGPSSEPVPLESLNVVIGANGAGKSNFLSLLGLLGGTVGDFQAPVLAGGGGPEWIHKSRKDGSVSSIRAVVRIKDERFIHELKLRQSNGRLLVDSEIVTFDAQNESGDLLLRSDSRGVWAKRGPYQEGNLGFASESEAELSDRGYQVLSRQNLGNSVLSEIGHLSDLHGLDKLRTFYDGVRLYGAGDFSPGGPARMPQTIGLNENRLEPDLSNLMNVVVGIRRLPERLDAVLARLRQVNPRIESVDIDSAGTYLQLVFREDGKIRTPAARLSEGTLRLLTLLAAIHQSAEPTVLCFEEPETGLHPDAIGEMVRILLDASKRTQVVVTTHNEKLVSALTGQPEVILIADIDEEGTRLRRLESDDLAVWLEDYSLGDLWASGQIGGVL